MKRYKSRVYVYALCMAALEWASISRYNGFGMAIWTGRCTAAPQVSAGHVTDPYRVLSRLFQMKQAGWITCPRDHLWKASTGKHQARCVQTVWNTSHLRWSSQPSVELHSKIWWRVITALEKIDAIPMGCPLSEPWREEPRCLCSLRVAVTGVSPKPHFLGAACRVNEPRQLRDSKRAP